MSQFERIWCIFEQERLQTHNTNQLAIRHDRILGCLTTNNSTHQRYWLTQSKFQCFNSRELGLPEKDFSKY